MQVLGEHIQDQGKGAPWCLTGQHCTACTASPTNPTLLSARPECRYVLTIVIPIEYPRRVSLREVSYRTVWCHNIPTYIHDIARLVTLERLRSQTVPSRARSPDRLLGGFILRTKNKIAGRLIPFLVLGFWDKNTGICAGAMPYRRDFPATTGI